MITAALALSSLISLTNPETFIVVEPSRKCAASMTDGCAAIPKGNVLRYWGEHGIETYVCKSPDTILPNSASKGDPYCAVIV